MQKDVLIEEDEIDLRELFLVLWKKKKFIVVFTMVVTLFSVLYVSFKSPIYEVTSNLRIGYIGETLLEQPSVLEKKLRIIFSVDNKQPIQKDNAIVSNIQLIKKVDNFLEVSTQGFSNELALEKNRSVISFLQKEYQYKIDESILKIDLNMEKLKNRINYIESIETKRIEDEIKRIKMQSIEKINQKISFIKDVEVKTIDEKLEFNHKKLDEYEKSLIKMMREKSSDNAQNSLMSLQVLNTQNLILNIKNQIDGLVLNKNNLLLNTIRDLEIQKENLEEKTLKELETKLNVDLKNEITNLQNSIKFEELKLKNEFAKNSHVVGEIEVSNAPIKPKKSLIVAVSFVTAFILSIFLVFIMQFFSSMRHTIIQEGKE